MTQSQALTAGALGFAAFALWYITRTPAKGAGTVTQTGQRERDAGLVSWFDTLRANDAQFAGAARQGLDFTNTAINGFF